MTFGVDNWGSGGTETVIGIPNGSEQLKETIWRRYIYTWIYCLGIKWGANYGFQNNFNLLTCILI